MELDSIKHAFIFGVRAFAEMYEPGTLQAVQLEDGSTAYIQHAVQVSQPNTILAIQTNGTDLHPDTVIDQETISALEQYTSKVHISVF